MAFDFSTFSSAPAESINYEGRFSTKLEIKGMTAAEVNERLKAISTLPPEKIEHLGPWELDAVETYLTSFTEPVMLLTQNPEDKSGFIAHTYEPTIASDPTKSQQTRYFYREGPLPGIYELYKIMDQHGNVKALPLSTLLEKFSDIWKAHPTFTRVVSSAVHKKLTAENHKEIENEVKMAISQCGYKVHEWDASTPEQEKRSLATVTAPHFAMLYINQTVLKQGPLIGLVIRKAAHLSEMDRSASYEKIFYWPTLIPGVYGREVYDEKSPTRVVNLHRVKLPTEIKRLAAEYTLLNHKVPVVAASAPAVTAATESKAPIATASAHAAPTAGDKGASPDPESKAPVAETAAVVKPLPASKLIGIENIFNDRDEPAKDDKAATTTTPASASSSAGSASSTTAAATSTVKTPSVAPASSSSSATATPAQPSQADVEASLRKAYTTKKGKYFCLNEVNLPKIGPCVISSQIEDRRGQITHSFYYKNSDGKYVKIENDKVRSDPMTVEMIRETYSKYYQFIEATRITEPLESMAGISTSAASSSGTTQADVTKTPAATVDPKTSPTATTPMVAASPSASDSASSTSSSGSTSKLTSTVPPAGRTVIAVGMFKPSEADPAASGHELAAATTSQAATSVSTLGS